MTTEPITLDYEWTRDEMRAYFAKQSSQFKTPWMRRVFGALLLCFALWTWNENGWLLNLLLILIAGHFLFFPRWLMWLMSFVRFRCSSSIPCSVEIDEQGLRYRHLDRKYPPGQFRWSRLSAIQTNELGVEFQFDRPWEGPFIPWKAFQNDEQRQEFLELVNEHLVKTPTDPAR